MKSPRLIATLAAVAAVGITLAGCSPSGASASSSDGSDKTLTVFLNADTNIQDLWQKTLIPAFENDNPGYTVKVDFDLHGAHAWVMGNEAWGLEPETLALCDDAVAIPIQRAESLNLAMAATVCLHSSAAARH